MTLLKEGDEDLEPDLGKNKKTHDKIDKQYPNGSSPLSRKASPGKKKCDQEFDSILRRTGNKASNALGSGNPPRPYLGHVGSI